MNQDLLLHSDSDRFFSPPYVGPSGWIGVYLDQASDWEIISDILRDAYLLTAPKRVAALLDAPPAAKPAVRKKAAAKKAASRKKRPN